MIFALSAEALLAQQVYYLKIMGKVGAPYGNKNAAGGGQKRR